MDYRIKSQALSRYLVIGMVGTVAVLLLVIIGYLLAANYSQREAQLQALEAEFDADLHAQLQANIETVMEQAGFVFDRAESLLREEAQEQVDQAHSIATALYRRERGRLPDSEIQSLILAALREQRFFNGRGYFFVDDGTGWSLLSPITPSVEGTNQLENSDPLMRQSTRAILDTVANGDGAGFVSYDWYVPGGDGSKAQKITYVRRFDPYGWILGTGDYVFRIREDLKALVLDRLDRLERDGNTFLAVLDGCGHVVRYPSVALPEGGIFEVRALQDAGNLRPLLERAQAGGGFIETRWRQPVTGELAPVLLRAESLPLADWVLVSGIFPEDAGQQLQQQWAQMRDGLRHNIYRLLVALGVAALVTLLLSLIYSRWLRRLFRQYQSSIDRSQAALEHNAQQLQLAARVFQAAREGIIISDSGNRILTVNSAYSQITGYAADEAVGRDPGFMGSGRHDKAFYQRLWHDLHRDGHWQGEVWNRRKSGEIYPQWLSISVCRNAAGDIEHYIATLSDISEHKRVEERLSYLANFDPLTDLPNRRMLEERIAQAVALSRRHPEIGFALLLVGIDRLEYINDSLGHGTGDRVLQQLAQRLSQQVRAEDTVFRLGGDVFAVLVQDGHSMFEVAGLARRLLKHLAEPLRQSGVDLVVTQSIGIAAFPADGENVEALLSNAAAALHHAKVQGRNRSQFFTREINDSLAQRLQMEQALRQALGNDELSLHYQPQYRLSNGALIGCEALLRWHSAELGPVGPDRFIPLAEETGMIDSIGRWVLHTACRQAALWRAQGLEVPVAVNVSACQLGPGLVNEVAGALADSRLPADLLTLELTETVLMQRQDETRALLQELRTLGVRLAMDDFGTGYSSLAYLKRFPIDKLKIDRAFVQGLPADVDGCAIIRAVLEVARHLGLATVAEGIETPEQQAFLNGIGCAEGQGYLFARPLPMEAMTALLLEARAEEDEAVLCQASRC
ncbi:MAG: EAL domain-containing protein [Oceanospirillaceae bacterium]|nr:EAL domain-containing protein [Oceanospirillaceae bacterium]